MNPTNEHTPKGIGWLYHSFLTTKPKHQTESEHQKKGMGKKLPKAETSFFSLFKYFSCRNREDGTCCEKQVVTKDRSWHLLLMVRKPQTTTWDVFETLKIMGSTTNLSTGELIPDFWLPSTVWSQNLNHQRLRLFCLRVGIVVLVGNLWICPFRPEP